MMWLEEGLYVTVKAERSTRRSITVGPSSLILSLHYFVPVPSLEAYLTTYYGLSEDGVRMSLDSFQDWSNLEE